MNASTGFARPRRILAAAIAVFSWTAIQSAQAADFDVSADFSTQANPGGPWSYGWKESLPGAFQLATYQKRFFAENGVPLMAWQAEREVAPSIAYVVGPGTAVSASGQFVAPPGTVWVNCGLEGTLHHFGVIRFTLPRGEGGLYRLEAGVAEVFDGPSQGDTDFHILHNGMEIFARDLAPRDRASSSGEIALVEGDTLEFAVGRGADGRNFGSGLKLKAALTRKDQDPPPPPTGVVHDLAGDFSVDANPGGPWSYGWKESLPGDFQLATHRKAFTAENWVPLMAWQAEREVAPSIAYVVGPGTAVSASGQFVAPPGTVWVNCGQENTPRHFGVIRFTLPQGQSGLYRLETTLREVFSGPSQGDTDFHLLYNGREIFGRDIAPHDSAGYTNELALVEGDTVEFAVGRGADGLAFGSGLKIEAVLRQVEPRPPGPDILRELIERVLGAPSTVNQEPLLASLQAAQASMVKGNTRSAIQQLRAFQNKVQAQVEPVDPSLAAQYVEMAQRIIEWLDPDAGLRLELAGMAGMPVVLEKMIRVPGIGICVEASAMPGSNLQVERSKSLAEWTPAGVALEISDGRFQFLDHNPAGARYYRMRILEE